MKRILAGLMTASLLMPTMALAGPPRRLMHSDLQDRKNVTYKPLCLDAEDKFTEECDIVIDETGVQSPQGHITNVVQWGVDDEKYDVATGIVGGAVGGTVGLGLGMASCYIVLPLCLTTMPLITAGGMGLGSGAGQSGSAYFTVIGDDKDGNRIVLEFKHTKARTVKKTAKSLIKTTGLAQGELKV